MSQYASFGGADDPPVRREEALAVALLLGFTGGYVDTFTWITQGILANAQTANLVFLWVYAAKAEWQQAFHFAPPLFAFGVGVLVAGWLRRATGTRAPQISLFVEIAMLVLVGVLHNHLPAVAGTLGISLVAAMQTSIFTRVEGSAYSSVMITGNFRQAIEGAFALTMGDRQAGRLRKACIYLGVCATFGTGAAAGALLTENLPRLTLIVPAIALIVVVLLCRTWRLAEVAQQAE